MNQIYAYNELANAIIVQAIKDYRNVLRAIHNFSKDASVLRECRRIEKFFRSEWFSVLTDVDPEYLIGKIKAEVESSGGKRRNKTVQRVGKQRVE